MNKFLVILGRHWSKNPFKISLTILSVALGTAILMLSFSLNATINHDIQAVLHEQGNLVMVSNATLGSTGEIEPVRPGEWTMEDLNSLAENSDILEQAVPISSVPFTEVQAGGKSWQLRRALGTAPGYFEILGLTILVGEGMTDQDLGSTERRVWISETLANQIFGGTREALGQKIQPPAITIRRFSLPGQSSGGETNGSTASLTTIYTVAGVYQAPPEVFRRAYGVADMVFAYTNVLPGSGNNATFLIDMMAGTFLAQSKMGNLATTESAIRESMESITGEDVSMVVWEGSPEGSSSYLTDLRQTMDLFSVAVTLLGLILLLISSLGIFSVMVIESLGRKRDIALERAIGASQGQVVMEFWTWSMALSLMGAVVGLVFAILLSQPVMGSLSPLFSEFGSAFSTPKLDPLAIGSAMGLALGFGGVLGLLPGIAAVRGSIADVLREV